MSAWEIIRRNMRSSLSNFNNRDYSIKFLYHIVLEFGYRLVIRTRRFSINALDGVLSK